MSESRLFPIVWVSLSFRKIWESFRYLIPKVDTKHMILMVENVRRDKHGHSSGCDVVGGDVDCPGDADHEKHLQPKLKCNKRKKKERNDGRQHCAMM